MLRKIITIDEEKCDGCGLCVPGCKEGALQVIDGKARLVSEVYCDGLGACLGECPQGAIRLEEREAPAFDEAAVERHLAGLRAVEAGTRPAQAADRAGKGGPGPGRPHAHVHHGCPGSAMRVIQGVGPASTRQEAAAAPSALGHWPVQLMLVPPAAPFLRDADLLVCADCVPFAVPDFHTRYLSGRAVVVGCPKLDDLGFYREKLEAIFRQARPRSLTVLRMEVPCCGGIAQAAVEAWRAAGFGEPVPIHVIGVEGGIHVKAA